MRLDRLQVKNFKSLRDVGFRPGDFTLVVGPNASGKTNLVECLTFLSEVYLLGLDTAVSRHGGYENMAFRRAKRSKNPVSFLVEISYQRNEIPFLKRRTGANTFWLRHEFSFKAKGESVRAPFSVHHERLTIDSGIEGARETVVEIERDASGDLKLTKEPSPETDQEVFSSQPTGFFSLVDLKLLVARDRKLAPTELIATTLGRYVPAISVLLHGLTSFKAFQISPSKARSEGVPSPHAQLDSTGGNLPAVVDFLRSSRSSSWKRVLSSMRRILPSLRDIEVVNTGNRTLQLQFREDGFGKAWNIWEVSDGTVQALALLVALHDSRYSLLVLEELENSVHPWIIRHLVRSLLSAAKRTQVLVTTHSPIVIDAVDPSQVQLMWRQKGESKIERLSSLDAAMLQKWADGRITTFEYLDSGVVSQAVPPTHQWAIDFEDPESELPRSKRR